jgi:hypothetical protein
MMRAKLHRAGELTGIWISDDAHEAMRDLVRARAPPRSCICLVDAGCVPAPPHGIGGKPSEGRIGCGGADRSVRFVRFPSPIPHEAYLGCIPGTNGYSDAERHPKNEPLPGVIAFRPEASLLHINADSVMETVLNQRRNAGLSDICVVVCDLLRPIYV